MYFNTGDLPSDHSYQRYCKHKFPKTKNALDLNATRFKDSTVQSKSADIVSGRPIS